MIRKILLAILFVLCLLLLSALTPIRDKINRYIFFKQEQIAQGIPLAQPPVIEYDLEKIAYDIKLGGLKIGSAEFEYLGPAELDGRQAERMTFHTRLANFNDLEEIYSDPVSFLPLRVIRTIKGWNLNEQITESYDQKGFLLTITKLKGDKQEETVIRKKGVIQNAILLPFYVRRLSELNSGWELPVCLPTQDFKIRFNAKETIKLPSGVFETFRFESVPERFFIWVTTDEERVPVKIKGSGKFGYAFEMHQRQKRKTYFLSLPKIENHQ